MQPSDENPKDDLNKDDQINTSNETDKLPAVREPESEDDRLDFETEADELLDQYAKPTNYTGRKNEKYRATECLNCGHPLQLTDVYCSYCAQMNSTKKLSVGDFFEEFFSSIINYDSRFRTSIKTLLFKPGVMSREFINGKRMKYVNPFRFYLSISILFFILLGLIANFDEINFDNDELIEKQLENGIGKVTVDGVPVANLAELDSIIKAKDNRNLSLDSLLKRRKFKRDSVKSTKTYKDRYRTEQGYDTLSFFNAMYERGKLYADFNQETGINNPRVGLDSLKHVDNSYHRWVYRKAIDAETMSKEPGKIIEYFFTQLPFVIFFFIPIFALFVWLIYIRRKYTYTDHMVFLFHTQTMFFVLYGLAMLVDLIIEAFKPEYDSGLAAGIATLLFLFYLYKAMRNFYKQGRIKTIVKFLILNWVFFILASFGAFVAFAISFATY